MTTEERNAAIERFLAQDRYSFRDLVDITEILRMPGGCAWDAEQTHQSIRDEMIEETYEVVEAIDNSDPVLLREELGDALFQVVFHSQISSEEGNFDISDVISDIAAKLVHRHPHVFGSLVIETSDAVLENWEKIKIEEKKRETLVSRLEAVPPQLPALMRASKIAKKTEFWYGEQTLAQALEAVKTELLHLENAPKESAETLAGELLYRVVCLCRKLSVSAETALSFATARRIDEIRIAEAAAGTVSLDLLTPEERAELRKRLDALDAKPQDS